MRFLIDECVARPLVEALRKHFDDVVSIGDRSPAISDRSVLQQAVQERRILVTEDYDFGELVFRQRLAADAVIIIAPGVLGFDLSEDAKRVADRIHGASARLSGNLTIVERRRIRQRALPKPR